MTHPPAIRLAFAPDELIIDNFAGGGGASTGIEMALGRPVDIAINHDPEALAMHAANHPHALHLCENVWQVDIRKVVAGRKVGLAWFSPDCKHFSKAKGGKPVEKDIRGLAWVVLKWAALAQPRVIILENVQEFQTWGPIVDGKPCPRRKGMTYKRWVTQLRNLGYQVDSREIRACDYGAPTIRKRLFVVARRDRQKIVWPEETHGPKGNLFLQPYRTAAECIDWSIPCPSIFTRKRPLAEATLRRIARGVKRYVIDAAEPFIVPIAHYNGSNPVHPINEPLLTITAHPKGGAFALCSPTLIQTGYGERDGQAPRVPGLDKPLGTVVAGGAKHALVAAFLAQHNGGYYDGDGRAVVDPLSTVTATGAQQQVVTSHLIRFKGTCRDGQPVRAPLGNIEAQGTHWGEVRAFLLKYYGTDQDPRLDEPMHTLTTKHRMGLVTVYGRDYIIVDIGMRMLTPRELFRAQGFPSHYIIDRTATGEPLTKTAQVRMCGNSVSPPPACALVRAQFSVKTIAVAA